MAVVREFALPDLGEGLTEATIVRWLVEVGEVVAVDQPVVEVETAKAMVDVPCPYGGVVTARFGDEGAEVPVGAPLVTVAVGSAPEAGAGPEPQSAPDRQAEESGGADRQAEESGGADSTSGNVLVGYGTSEPTARRRRIRPFDGVPRPPAPAPHSGRTRPAGHAEDNGAAGAGAGRPGDVRAATAAPASDAAPATGSLPVISPLVRRLARENGLDLGELTGSGPSGLILRSDVERAVRARTAPVRAAAPGRAQGRFPADAERVPLRGMRGAAAEKFTRSRQEIPDATCWVDADATELLAVRAQMNVPGAPKISVLALLARICTAALARFPELNATVDTQANEIVRLPAVHLGFAAQTDRGLMVPVLRDAQARTVEELSDGFARLTEKARGGTLTLDELTHGTFTLNNYGVFGVDGSTPIINHPEAAMLGVGRIAAKPWVHEGELAVRQVVQLSLTFDHRVCDGGTAGGFLRYVADCVEHPALLLRAL